MATGPVRGAARSSAVAIACRNRTVVSSVIETISAASFRISDAQRLERRSGCATRRAQFALTASRKDSPRMADRILDPWGPGRRTRGAATGRRGSTSTRTAPVERWVQSACVLCSNGCALDIGVRDGRIVGVRGRGSRPRQPRPARARRACTAGRPTTAADRLTAPARPPRRRAARGELGRGDGPRRRALARAARDEGQRRARLLHERPAVPRGVLHARAHRARRDRHAPPRRQHAALHGDGRAGAEGDVRLRRPAGLRTRHRVLRHDPPRRASTSPRRRRCCGCASSTGCAGPTRRARS